MGGYGRLFNKTSVGKDFRLCVRGVAVVIVVVVVGVIGCVGIRDN